MKITKAMELNYTKKRLKNGAHVRSIDLHLEALKSFYNTKDNYNICQKENKFFFDDKLLINLSKALKVIGSDYIKKEFLISDYTSLSSEQKGYLNEFFIINFFLKKSYKWILYRSKKYFSEVDLLFFYQGCYHLIEVKSHSPYNFDMGFISNKQKERLKKSFCCLQKDFYPLRSHLVSVDTPNKEFYIFFDFLY
ncbi:MAG: hypothetical protein HAW60_03395 [Bdellovibrionales bacterium]|nr:hypothetical protein [Bdellovibrionales bacterium]